MKYGSVCSGIEAATVAWHPLGWKPAFFSEIENFPRAVLAHHYPDVPLHGDFTTIQEHDYDPINLLVGGTPCQAFSIAGLRKGFSDERGNLTLEFIRLAQRLSPRWLVWENVPGVLSIDGGRAFGSFLGGLAELGFGFAYRVLDAQHFGVPQRRRRVFVVGYFGDWRPAAAVLFESESLRRDITPRREKREGTAANTGNCAQVHSHWDGDFPHPTLNQSASGSGGIGYSNQELFSQRGAYLAPVASTGEISHCLNAGGMGRQDYETETLTVTPINTQIATRSGALGEGTGLGIGKAGDPAFTLQAAHHHAVAIPIHDKATRHKGGREGDDGSSNGLGIGKPGDPMPTLDTACNHAVAFPWQSALDPIGNPENLSGTLTKIDRHAVAQPIVLMDQGGSVMNVMTDGTIGTLRRETRGHEPSIIHHMALRRLTPRECERLQGFPDDYTLIPHRGKPAADGNRYKALGNSMAVPVMRWLGERIAMVEEAQKAIKL